MMARALCMLMVLPIATISRAHAEAAGGIQISPVMVAMTTDHHIASLRLRNGRDRPVSFEVDAYAWSQHDGQDELTPTQDVVIAPGVFEVAPGHEQVVRLGVIRPRGDGEQSYRLVLRELPSPLPGGNRLGFTLEMSLPVFVTPVGAEPDLSAALATSGQERALVLSNRGAAHAQVLSMQDAAGDPLRAPRYLLAGSSAPISLGHDTRQVVLVAADGRGVRAERTIDVAPLDPSSAGR